ncbi:translation initiation factor IF-3 [uncultured Mobiluncus sp.]|uniref:translation initiation factor IF-3 n=1 Tax=uncultured Mobiluncus sp. TaxID=293425 RepID=UPI00260D3936|nr:translation initiation factor IF-3 [uncultured Mobiluncus sp.]
MTDVRINDQIRVPEVRLIGANGEQIGVVATMKAITLADDAGLDLVEVAPEAHPPVCKLMDYGKYKYEAAQKARDQRRNQASTQLKEIRLGLKIDDHDYEVKKGHILRFLDGGDKVKIMIKFRGREQSRPEMGIKLLERLAEDIADDGVVESAPRQDGRSMTMVIGPVKKKTDAVSQQRKRREDERQAKRDAKAERALRNQQRVAQQANAPVLKPLTFDQLGSGNLAAVASQASESPAAKPAAKSPARKKPASSTASETSTPAAKPAANTDQSPEADEKPATRKAPARKTTAKPAAKTAAKTTAAADKPAATTAKAPARRTTGTTKKAAPKTTAGKTDKPATKKAPLKKEEK